MHCRLVCPQCDPPPVVVLFAQFTGIAAQDFTTDGGPFKATRKWEQFPKNMHKSYVWTKFKVPLKPDDSRNPYLDKGYYNAVYPQVSSRMY